MPAQLSYVHLLHTLLSLTGIGDHAATMSQSVALKCLDKYGFPLAGLTAAEQAVRTEAAARETKLLNKWSRQVGYLPVLLSSVQFLC